MTDCRQNPLQASNPGLHIFELVQKFSHRYEYREPFQRCSTAIWLSKKLGRLALAAGNLNGTMFAPVTVTKSYDKTLCPRYDFVSKCGHCEFRRFSSNCFYFCQMQEFHSGIVLAPSPERDRFRKCTCGRLLQMPGAHMILSSHRNP